MGQGALMQVLHQLPKTVDKDLLVGIETADDAGVYRVTDDLAIITTIDFFPPIVDDPFLFGQISAANALSDVYAMGGVPRLVMNVVCFPKDLDGGILKDIISGGLDKITEAGAILVGGHSIDDNEIKYGLSVTGFVHPKKITPNSGARPGDVLVLTKPIGTGIITSAVKARKIKPEAAEAAYTSMKTLNKGAAQAMGEAGVNACTDVTGYGLLGHAMEMAKGSGVNIVIRSKDIRIFPGAAELVKLKACRPRTISTTREYLAPDIRISPGVDESLSLVFFDPQTSGGLLISVAEERSKALLEKLVEARLSPCVVGKVVEKEALWTITVE